MNATLEILKKLKLFILKCSFYNYYIDLKTQFNIWFQCLKALLYKYMCLWKLHIKFEVASKESKDIARVFLVFWQFATGDLFGMVSFREMFWVHY